MFKFIHLVIGGALGTVSRYLLGGFVYRCCPPNFPYGTLVVNLAGCFLIGFLASMAERKFFLGADVRTFLMIGFCGAFTTFSSLIFETDALVRDGQFIRALINVTLSIVLGFLFFRIGSLTAEVL